MRGIWAVAEALPRGGMAAALLVDGRLEDLLIDPPPHDPVPRVGAIYRARPGRPLKGLGGAIVDLGGGRTGFLRETRGLSLSAPALVQVTTAAEPHKAPPVSTRILLKRRHVILTPGAPGINFARGIADEDRPRLAALVGKALGSGSEDLGLILRSAAASVADEAISRDVAACLDAWAAATAPGRDAGLLVPAPDAAARAQAEWEVEPTPARAGAFAEHGVLEQIDALLLAEVPLPGGGRLVVEPTRALVAVDVDTGGDLSPAAGIKASLAAARELPRQLRLRGLGGQIAIDFAALPRRERPRIEHALRAALARDGIETALAGWTPLGHLELNRKRVRRPISELLPLGRG